VPGPSKKKVFGQNVKSGAQKGIQQEKKPKLKATGKKTCIPPLMEVVQFVHSKEFGETGTRGGDERRGNKEDGRSRSPIVLSTARGHGL